MNLRQAAEQALRQLQKDDVYLGHRSKTRADAIDALRQALAEEEPWVKTYCGGKPNYTTPVDTANMSQECVDETVKRKHEPMASVPEKPDTWVGLTDEEIESELTKEFGQWWSRHVSVCRAIEAKLKEKNNG